MKQMDIRGTLVYPLEIGRKAVIKEAHGMRTTSAVQHYVVNPSGEIYIQTKNTHYYLHPPIEATVVKGR